MAQGLTSGAAKGQQGAQPPEAAGAPASAGFRQDVLACFDMKEQDIRTYSALGLAFLGDAVYSLIARTIVFSKGNRQAEKMHNESREYVSARAQAALGDAMQPYLDEEEADVYRRGLHSNPYHHAKNASIEEYMKATAVETLCGYLYTTERLPRFLELMHRALAEETKRK